LLWANKAILVRGAAQVALLSLDYFDIVHTSMSAMADGQFQIFQPMWIVAKQLTADGINRNRFEAG